MEMIHSTEHLDKIEYAQIAENYYLPKEEMLLIQNDAKNNIALQNKMIHLDLCRLIATRRKDLMFTAQSAAFAYGISRDDSIEMRPNCISDRHKRSDIIRWHYGMRDPKARSVNGIFVASPTRTICDLAKLDNPESLLVSINHCLYMDLFSKNQLLYKINSHSRMKGSLLLKRLLQFATNQCESALETIAWIAIHKAKFVMPQQQVIIKDKHDFIGRVDMYWKLGSRKIVLELDGVMKYTDLNNTNALINEKRREDKLRRLGYEVIRMEWKDVKSGRLVAELTARHIPLRKHFTGNFPTGR
jgi:very-short-patch-repair endonuclease